jgi:predicted ATPase with chaperone activity
MGVATIPAPQGLEELRVRRNLLEDLALKILYLQGESTLKDLAEKMRLSLPILEEIFQRLRKEALCEVKGLTGSVYRIDTTSQGKERALELLSLNQYAGPAPVSLSDYVSRVVSQTVMKADVRPAQIERAFQHLVLDDQTLTQLGTAVVSGTSVFLYGPTGTGKTAIAESLPAIYEDQVWVPYAMEIDGQIITIYDTVVHERIDRKVSPDDDQRWVLCRRPRVMTGGELTIEMLDLQFNPVTKFYAAPLQLKANNGVLIIDDFGRQRMRPEEMLNRWIVPLDRRIDYLTLAGGKKFDVPFDLLVVFATNLDPRELTDEAFLRRIHNKIKVGYVTPERFQEISRRVCQHLGLAYDAAVIGHLIDVLVKELKQPLRACYPRDVIHQICWAAAYQGKRPQLEAETVAQACRNYFLPPE